MRTTFVLGLGNGNRTPATALVALEDIVVLNLLREHGGGEVDVANVGDDVRRQSDVHVTKNRDVPNLDVYKPDLLSRCRRSGDPREQQEKVRGARGRAAGSALYLDPAPKVEARRQAAAVPLLFKLRRRERRGASSRRLIPDCPFMDGPRRLIPCCQDTRGLPGP
jgi:hypothetical protein